MKRSFLFGVVIFLSPAPVWAGMPSIRLSDVARLRFDAISFFLVGLLLSAFFIKLLWNWLARDFSALPRLTYPRALCLVILWGLLFILVLTMISGARELMTPGAWEKQGLTYRLADTARSEPADILDRVREQKLAGLRAALWKYAEEHDGQFPSDASAMGLPAETWQVPDASGMRYLYLGGQSIGPKIRPLAWEPELYGPRRLVLLTSGEIRFMDGEEITRAAQGEKR
jgi:hypothetical protein